MGDNYVHRLIQSKTGGKLVEVPSPMPPNPHRGQPPADSHHASIEHSCGGGSRGAGGRPGSGGMARAGSLGPYGSSEEYEGEGFEGQGDDGMEEAMMASKLDHIAAGGPIKAHTPEVHWLCFANSCFYERFFECLLQSSNQRVGYCCKRHFNNHSGSVLPGAYLECMQGDTGGKIGRNEIMTPPVCFPV